MSRVNPRLYQVFDTCAELVIGPIMLCLNDQMATREFAKWIARGELKEHYQDYRLLRLGTIDDFGHIEPEDPSVVITGVQTMETLKARE